METNERLPCRFFHVNYNKCLEQTITLPSGLQYLTAPRIDRTLLSPFAVELEGCVEGAAALGGRH